MAEGTIDWLAIEVSGDASKAVGGIDSLVSSLHRLDKSLSAPTKKLGQLSRALRQLKTDASGVDLSGIKISASTARNLKSLAATARGLDGSGMAALGKLATGLGALSAVDTKGIGRAVTQLKKLPAVFSEFSKLNMGSLISQLNRLNSSIAPLASNVARLAHSVNALPKSLRTAGAAARTVSSANKNLQVSYMNAAGGASGLRVRTMGLIAASQGLFNGLAYLIDQSTRYVENMNLFEASMGSATQAATEFGMKCQELMGIDFGELARYQGVFETLVTGMGETKEHADVMSQQLTQLGYDIASFFNISVEDSMLKLQSGIAGELEPLRRIGWDLSDARMQIEATKLGIDANTQTMTQAEKVALRYYMIMNQVTIVHGDMARTLASPANQLRVLKMQLQLAARTVGNLFIPALNAILPVAIAVVKAITMIAQAIASLFGIDATFEVDYSGLDTSGIATGADAASDALDDVGGAASGASDKVKELKNTVMGFDELNKLNDVPDDSGGGGGGGGGAGGGGLGGFDIPLDTYDFFNGLTDKINQVSSEMARKIVDTFKAIAPVIAGIGAGFLAWKLAPKLMQQFEDLKKIMAVLKGSEGLAGIKSLMGGLNPVALGIGLAVGVIVGHFVNLVVNSKNFRRGCETIFDVLKNIGSYIEPLSNFTAGALSTIVGIIAQAAGIDLSPVFNALGKVGDFIMDIGSLVNQVFDLQWTDAIMLVAACIAGALCPPLGIAIGVLEGVSLAIRGLGFATSPVTEKIDALGGVSEETAARFGTSLDSMTDAYGELSKCSLPNAVVSEEDIATVEARIQDVHDTIVNNLDAKRNEELAGIDLLADMLPEETVQQMKDRVNEVYDNQVTRADQAQQDLYNIYRTAAEERRGLTAEEAEQVKQIQDQLQEDLIQSSSASAEEIETIRSNMKNNNTAVALEEASNVIKAAQEKRDQEVRDAWDTYDQKMAAANAAFEAGDITQEQYDAIKQASLDAAQTQQDAANETYYGENGVLANVKNGLGDAADQMDFTTGEIKEKWQVWCGNLGSAIGDFADGAQNTLSLFTTSAGQSIASWCSSRKGDFDNFKANAGQSISNFADGAKSTLGVFTSSAGQNIANWCSTRKGDFENFKANASQNISSFAEGAKSTLGSFTSSAAQNIADWCASRKGDFESFKTSAGQSISNFATEAQATFGSFTSSVSNSVASFASDTVSKLKGLGDSAGGNWRNFTSNMSGAWSSTIGSIGSWYNSNLSPLFGSLSSLASWAGNQMYAGLSNPVGWVKDAWAGVGNWFVWNVGNPVSNAFWSIVNSIRSAMNWIIGRLNCINIKLPRAAAMVTGYSSIGFSIPYLANGGQVDAGQLFVAREAGPELVGTMGGKTTVANNEQIIAGIERGVINAMVQVLGNQPSAGAGADTQVTFVVGSEELARTVVKGMRTLDARGEISVDFA